MKRDWVMSIIQGRHFALGPLCVGSLWFIADDDDVYCHSDVRLSPILDIFDEHKEEAVR